LRSVLAPHAELLRGKGLVSLTKGIEAQSFKLMSQILEEIAPRRASACCPGRTWRARSPSTR
jgi:glycerol-3-phosphate dehydrogenase